MKNGYSFDVPAYKFGILKLNDPYRETIERNGDDSSIVYECIEEAIGFAADFIPFESVDGLTVEEVKNALALNGPIIFICYNYFTIFNNREKSEWLKPIDVLVLDKKTVNANLSMQIDQVIEKAFEKSYAKSSEDEKKVMKCFFERYQDGTHQDTVERVKFLEMSIKKN